ncbi:MAG TPA: ubiquitin-like small modifier protein 1 [Anaerolineae bacterium]
MPVVKLFGNLRNQVGKSRLDVPGETVQAALDVICAGNAALRAAIFAASGEVRAHVRVMVNGHDIELAQGLETPVGAADQIAVFPPMAGG